MPTKSLRSHSSSRPFFSTLHSMHCGAKCGRGWRAVAGLAVDAVMLTVGVVA